MTPEDVMHEVDMLRDEVRRLTGRVSDLEQRNGEQDRELRDLRDHKVDAEY